MFGLFRYILVKRLAAQRGRHVARHDFAFACMACAQRIILFLQCAPFARLFDDQAVALRLIAFEASEGFARVLGFDGFRTARYSIPQAAKPRAQTRRAGVGFLLPAFFLFDFKLRALAAMECAQCAELGL